MMATAAYGAVALAAIAVIISTIIARWLCSPRSPLYVLDHPNERSLHSRPTPRTGGVAILVAAILCGSVFVIQFGSEDPLFWIVLAATIVAATSLVDDRQSLHPAVRFTLHVVAAASVVLAGLVVETSWWPGTARLGGVAAAGATLLYVVWMLELYNFMDGMDGFAGGMSVIGFTALAALAVLGGAPLVASLSLIVAGASLGFLLVNFPPARIFMGDVGAATLGFVAATFSLWAARSGAVPLWAAMLVFSPFCVDATVTLARRALRRERIWQAHKTHYYQRLAQLGWPHRTIVLYEYALMIGAAVSAVVARSLSPPAQWVVLLAWAIVYALLAYGVSRLEMGRQSPSLQELTAE